MPMLVVAAVLDAAMTTPSRTPRDRFREAPGGAGVGCMGCPIREGGDTGPAGRRWRWRRTDRFALVSGRWVHMK
ncbi:hypothetical protein GCM10009527_007380 [Actinomadura nitritigenes]